VIKLLGEASIGSGVRRVEALVGGDAYRFLAREHVLVAQLSEALKTRPEQLPERVNDLVERLRTAEKEVERVRMAQLLSSAGDLARDARDVYGVSYVGRRVDGAGAGDVRKLALDIRGRLPGDRPGVVAVIGDSSGKPAVVVTVNDAARAWRRRPGRRRRRDPRRRGAAGGRARGRTGRDHPMRRGVRLGVDVGDVRIGIARSDPSGMIATPVETVPRGRGDRSGSPRSRPRRRPSRWWWACRAASPAARGPRRRRCAASPPS
jgi:hypothetical protein